MARREDAALLVLAIDDLRRVNFELGHAVGDRLIGHVGHLIRLSCQDGGVCGRLGGNAFGAILSGTTASRTRSFAERLIRQVGQEPLRVEGRTIAASISIGIAVGRERLTADEESLISAAFDALGEARRQGRGLIRTAGTGDEADVSEANVAESDDYAAAMRCVVDLKRKLHQARLESIMSLVAAVDAKDAYTQRHSINVSLYAGQFAQALGLSGEEIEYVSNAALLHDIGKIGISDAILTKPGRLTTEEFDEIKRHPEIGAAILQHVPSLRRLSATVLHHHEWFDGRGYPHGLAGEAIPQGSRIIHVADAIDAMMSPRCYTRARDAEYVIAELRAGRGGQFDPAVADHTVRWLEERAQRGAASWASGAWLNSTTATTRDPQAVIH